MLGGLEHERFAELKREARQKAARGAEAGCRFLAGIFREVLNVQAPRRRVKGNGAYFAATEPATPGAPPRKVSGDLQRSTQVQVIPAEPGQDGGAQIVCNAYGRILEDKGHPWIEPTLDRFQQELEIVVGAAMQVER